MKQLFKLVIVTVFIFGLLFPVSSTSKSGPSPFFEEIKKFFHYYPEDTKKTGVKKAPSMFKEELKKQLRYSQKEEK